MKERHGFTLVEIAIVLVVIALVAGGVLVGKDLIRAAEDRAGLQEIQAFDTAVTTFRLKYNCLPGDCPNATQFFGQSGDCLGSAQTTAATCNGTGDGKITTWGAYGEPEAQWAVHQLGSAGLIAPVTHPGEWSNPGMVCNGTGVVIPGRNAPALPWAGTGLLPMTVHASDTDAANPGFCCSTYFAESQGNQLLISGQGSPCDTAPGRWWSYGTHASGAVSTQRLLGIERKIDDGFPRSGKVTAGGTNTSGPCVAQALPVGAYNYTETDTCFVPFLVRPSW